MDPTQEHKGEAPPATIAGLPTHAFWLLVIPKLLAVPVWYFYGILPALIVFFSPAPWFIYHLLVPQASGLVKAYTHFNTKEREVWLTIDDGPSPETTPVILDWLEAHHAKATFFVIGSKAARYPALLQEIIRRGHQLGNHTQEHHLLCFWAYRRAKIIQEIDRCQATIGRSSPWLRTPAGIKNPFIGPLLFERQLLLLSWSARGYDSCIPCGMAKDLLLRQTRPGAILLLHEHHHGRLNEMIPELLQELADQGYRFVIPAPDQVR